MIPVAEGQRRILEWATPLPVQEVRLEEAAGRFVAEAITAPISLPPFDNSAMDGYAVRSGDVGNASESSAVQLRLVGTTSAGQAPEFPVESGQCVRVFTGSPLPPGADAVVMQEDTSKEPGHPDQVAVRESVRPWENVRFKGEDVRAGTVVAETGSALTPARLGLLRALGLSSAKVHELPSIALLATGNELMEPGETPRPGTIYESNRLFLQANLRRFGFPVEIFPLVRDDLTETVGALESAFAKSKVVITTGGASVGDLDFLKPAFTLAGGSLDFWKVAMKPGKPFVFGRRAGGFLFGLPGNPVSAAVTFVILCLPALRKMAGAAFPLPRVFHAVLAESIENRGDRTHFVRVRYTGNGKVKPSGPQASHLLCSLADADALLEVPPSTMLRVDTEVAILPLD